MLAIDRGRLLEFFKGRAADLAVMAEFLHLQYPAIGREANLPQFRQVLDAPAHPEIVGIIDRGFGPQRPTLLVILLEVGVLIVDVQGRSHSFGNDARPTSAVGGSLLLHAALEDQLHLIRSAQIDVLADDFLEEATSAGATIPHLGEGKLGLYPRSEPPHPP